MIYSLAPITLPNIKGLAQIHSEISCTQGKGWRIEMNEWTNKAKTIYSFNFFYILRKMGPILSSCLLSPCLPVNFSCPLHTSMIDCRIFWDFAQMFTVATWCAELSDLGPHRLEKWLLKSQADDNCCYWQFKGWRFLHETLYKYKAWSDNMQRKIAITLLSVLT